MIRTEIIELANQLTERKGEKQLNQQSLYRFVVQDIAKRQRFWWRRIMVNFSLSPTVRTYDFTNATLFPALAEIAVEEITKLTLVITANPLNKAELVPIFDPESLVEMNVNTQLGQPGRYTMEAGNWSVLRLDPPDLAYNAYLVGWGMPNPASDSTNDAVPLIPPWGHNTIVAGMNAKIFKFAYGSKNEKTIDAQEEYEQGIQDLASKRQFDPNYRLQMSLSEDAVRST